MAAIGNKFNIGQVAQGITSGINAIKDKKPQQTPSSTTGKELGKWGSSTPSGGSSDSGTAGTSAPAQGTTYKTPGTDDLGNVDYSKQWDSALSGGADYDTLLGIYNSRNDKISGGGAYGQFAGDAKSQQMKAVLDQMKAEQDQREMEEYIKAMNAEKQKAALEALRAAYNKNVAGLDRAQADIAPQYQSARNEAAGQAELQKKNFAEYAAANGLNSGAGGQAQLSFANALQNNLSGIAQKEASTLADLELQRSQMASDYENAIAQAKAQGNYELAQQLYAEKVRQDEAMLQQMQWQAQQDLAQQQLQFNKDQANVGNDQWQQSFDKSGTQWDYQSMKAMADNLAQYGNFDAYKALGYSDEQIKSMKDEWDRLQQRSASRVSAGGGGTVSAAKPTLTYAQMVDAMERGELTPGVLSAYQYYNQTPYNNPENTQSGGAGMLDANFKGLKQTIYTWVRREQPQKALEVANQTWGTMTQAQRNELRNYFSGLGYTLGGE